MEAESLVTVKSGNRGESHCVVHSQEGTIGTIHTDSKNGAS